MTPVSGIAGYTSSRRPVETLAPLAAMLAAIRPRGTAAGLAAIDRRRGARRELAGRALADRLDEACPHDLGLAHCGRAPAGAEPPAGPRWNEARNLVLVADAELHNRDDLAAELEKRGHRLRDATDAELLLRAFEEWDLEAWPRLNGRFALALHDLRRGRLVLARDRLGEAPLFHAEVRGVLYFASEVAAIRAAAGDADLPVDADAVRAFALHGRRGSGSGSFYRGLRALEAASCATVGDELALRPVRWWRLPERRLEEREIDLHESCEVLGDLLADSVRLRARVASSPGLAQGDALDAAAIAGVYARADAGRIALFARADADGALEDPAARLIAVRWPRQVELHPLRAPRAEFWERAEERLRRVGEPFESPELDARAERLRAIGEQGCGALLVSTGADELLAGAEAVAEPLLASLVHASTAAFVRELAAADGDLRLRLARRLVLGAPRPRPPHPDLVALLASGASELLPEPASLEARLREDLGARGLGARLREHEPLVAACPFAIRRPFLDYRVVELAFQLPATYLIRHGHAKYALRRALEPLLPLPVAWRARRPSRPFPWREWLAASKAKILACASDSSLDGICAHDLVSRYDALLAADPRALWRVASCVLWHRVCNERNPLSLALPDACAAG